MIKQGLFIIFLFGLASFAWCKEEPIELLGVPLPPYVVVPRSAEKLSLNGYAAVDLWGQKTYVGALYTTYSEKRPEMLLINNEPLAMIFYFIRDDITAQMFKKVIMEGIIVNSEGWDNKWLDNSRMLSLKEAINQTYHSGDVLAFYYSPKIGLLMVVNNEIQQQWPHGKSLINLLLRMWIGPYPPSRQFKEGILNFPIH